MATITLNETEQYHNDLLHINAWNHLNVYRVLESLQKSLIKRKQDGKPITVEYLANCSTMRKVLAMAKEITRGIDHKTPNKKTCDYFRYNEAEMMIADLH